MMKNTTRKEATITIEGHATTTATAAITIGIAVAVLTDTDLVKNASTITAVKEATETTEIERMINSEMKSLISAILGLIWSCMASERLKFSMIRNSVKTI